MLKGQRLAGVLITLFLMTAGLGNRLSIAASPSDAASKPAAEQTRSTVSQKASSPADEVSILKQQLAQQEDQIEQLRQALSEQKQLLERVIQSTETAASAQPAQARNFPEATAASLDSVAQVASTTPMIPATPTSATTADATSPLPGTGNGLAPITASPQVESKSAVAKAPLTLTIGDADFTIGGFVDATAFFRTTNLGSGIGSSFGSVPFSNTPAGQLSELRFSAQNSRVSLMLTSLVHDWSVKGYLESDFLGTQPTNAFVISNSQTMRLRLYWAQLTRGKFEFLAGQSWSMLNPNRTGISPMPGDIFYSQNMDTNYQVGLTWSRNQQFRFIYHPSKKWAMGVSLENPQQYVGAATLPPNFPASEVDQGANVATPNLHPDIIGKIAYDPEVSGKHMHFEVAGLLSSFRTFNPTLNTKDTATGGGGSANFNLEVAKNLHFVLNTFYSDGGGRWIFGLGPDFIVKPDSTPSLVHASSAIGGFEYQANPNTLLYGYYGGAYFQRNTAIYIDPKTGKSSLIGFGYTGSPNSQNKSIQQPTFGVIQTFWQNPRYGKLQLITQYSYLTRAPWFVAPANPKNAHLSMGYADIRYVLP